MDLGGCQQLVLVHLAIFAVLVFGLDDRNIRRHDLEREHDIMHAEVRLAEPVGRIEVRVNAQESHRSTAKPR
jgi:hypothetical protein